MNRLPVSDRPGWWQALVAGLASVFDIAGRRATVSPLTDTQAAAVDRAALRADWAHIRQDLDDAMPYRRSSHHG